MSATQPTHVTDTQPPLDASDLERFVSAQRHVMVPSGRTAVLEAGPADGPVVLLLHGIPAWGYLWRRVIPELVEHGARVVAPDLLGYGRSERPDGGYSLELYDRWLAELVEHLDLRDATLVAHDFGGMIGLRHVGLTAAERFIAAVVLDTSLNDGTETYAGNYLAGFEAWKGFLATAPHPVLSPGSIIAAQANGHVQPEDVIAYDSVFPDDRSLAALRITETLYPLHPTAPGAAAGLQAKHFLSGWDAPVAILFSASAERFHPGHYEILNGLFPNIVSSSVVEETGHFLPEERPDLISRTIIELSSQVRFDSR